MKLTSTSLTPDGPIPVANAFMQADPDTHLAPAGNANPHLAWDDLPPGTKTIVVVCVDPWVPADASLMNQEGVTIPADAERVSFFHWGLVDVDPALGEIAEGAHGEGVVPGGKAGPDAPGGARHGRNTYTVGLAGDPAMAGDYFGWDGPCPPFNDEALHVYEVAVYATDLERFPLDGVFDAADIPAAIAGHVLDRATISAWYSTNPSVTG